MKLSDLERRPTLTLMRLLLTAFAALMLPLAARAQPANTNAGYQTLMQHRM